MTDPDLRTLFDGDAARYDRARPGYPEALFDDLREHAAIGSGDRVAEIGPGTGQATAGLAAGGAHVVAVELGAQLAATLQRRLPDVDVVVSAFEDWLPPSQAFDTVAAFTSWHWLDPTVRGVKVAGALRPGGMLATVDTVHVSGGTDTFFAASQDCYLRWDPDTEPGVTLPPADEVQPSRDEIDDSELFVTARRFRYQQDVEYSTRSYLDLLGTYSGHRALAPERQDGLFACLADLIDRRFASRIVKRYLYELRLAPRASVPAAPEIPESPR